MTEGEDRVAGAVVEVKAPETLFPLLDELQPLCDRVTVTALTEGDSLPVLIYSMPRTRLPRSCPRIIGGDWQGDLERRPDLVSRLSERHRTYLERLGASNGRMPQDLTLYRELLKLELIVDRGRSVGLSKLGQEVVRYLPKNVDICH